jgi:hypothetical protein
MISKKKTRRKRRLQRIASRKVVKRFSGGTGEFSSRELNGLPLLAVCVSNQDGHCTFISYSLFYFLIPFMHRINPVR